jgi:hypothetical protein
MDASLIDFADCSSSETTIEVNRLRCWVYATIDVNSKLLLGIRISRWQGGFPASAQHWLATFAYYYNYQ